MRLAIDAMGNDNGPAPIIEGVQAFLRRNPHDSVVLVGDRERLDAVLAASHVVASSRLEIVHASQVMEMNDKISVLREKRDSSIARTVKVVKDGEADAMIALGNTAGAVGAATLGLRTLKGVHRPGIALPLPTRPGGICILTDAGANTIAKPRHLLDYGVMASIYSERILQVDNPRVGLLNVGEEIGKGNDILREAFELLENAPINFVGNVEGRDIYNGSCDVVVCDGFIGNVVLKASEELAKTMRGWIKEAIHSKLLYKIGGMLAKGAFKEVKRRSSPDTYGGAPLLGVNGICIIGHGSSSPLAVRSALEKASESVSQGLNDLIRDRVASLNGHGTDNGTESANAKNSDA